MKLFRGYRPAPPEEYVAKGITNQGEADYEGVVFSDGTVVVRWLTQYRSHSVWSCWDDFYQVHGHPEYGTRIEWEQADVAACLGCGGMPGMTCSFCREG